MQHLIRFLRENSRFVAALIANALALAASIWWLIETNWNSNKQIEIEPIVSSLALAATLLGLNFVNDKLTKPHLRVHLRTCMLKPENGPIVHGFSITVENHSIQKAFISSYRIELPATKQSLHFLYDGFTGQPIQKGAIEPGQAFSVNISSKGVRDAPQNLSEIGDLVVATDTGYEFKVPASKVREHVRDLRRSEA
jgi:hypothetical protein